MKLLQIILILSLFFQCNSKFPKNTENEMKTDKKPNHLLRQTSPYLLQHLYNPVDWYPWGVEALEKAKKEDKPILVSIGYSACHWCHVMEKECFENDSISYFIN